MGTILAEGTRKKTRKDHFCIECGQKIPKGEPANFQSNVGFDWGACTVYWHTTCDPDFSEDY